MGETTKRKFMKIYVASSWRNNKQQEVVITLRNQGHDVYDYRNPKKGNVGFAWSEIDENWQTWSPDRFVTALYHPLAEKGFKLDFDAMNWADVCVLVMPCGRSAHVEAGWMKGAGKPTYVLLSEGEPELMYKIFDLCTDDLEKIIFEISMLEQVDDLKKFYS